ncbi:DUF2971 domain-containing protein [Methylobacter tundripaludum]|uniref:DUF2971 domain-containing protein n=1 Tax=Methylobacter tundripaludum TaxID=173365 RepID=UPI0004DF0E55|nr:DUF2971 domain-containing protein [Methylobacter tundripaludum]
MNHYDSYNDPFECWCEVLEGFPKKDSNSSRFRSVIYAWGFDDVNDQAVFENYDEYISSLEDAEPSVGAIIDNARISCFSKTGDNLLMWSHYGDGLRGFCIEFDRNLILANNSNTARIYDVLYRNSPSLIDTAVIAVLNDQVEYHEDAIYAAEQEIKHFGVDRKEEAEMYKVYLNGVYIKNNEIYQKMLATKPNEWSYEEEIRIIYQTTKPEQSGEFFNYPSEAIKSVIFGERMPDRQVQVLRKLLERHPSPIILKKASRAKGKFNVIVSNGV